jgi:hypothetical protein
LANTPLGSVKAWKNILSVNGHLESFGYFQRKLMHVFTYASMTRRLTEKESKVLGMVRLIGLKRLLTRLELPPGEFRGPVVIGSSFVI